MPSRREPVNRPLPVRLEQFQEKCAAVLRPELRKNKEIERFRGSKKSESALGMRFHNYAYAIFIKLLILNNNPARGRKSGSAFNVCR